MLLLPGTATLITASPAPLPRSPEILIDRLRGRQNPDPPRFAPYIRHLFTNDRYREMEQRLKEADVPMNTDIRPVCYAYAAVLWLARFFPTLAVADLSGLGETSGAPDTPPG